MTLTADAGSPPGAPRPAIAHVADLYDIVYAHRRDDARFYANLIARAVEHGRAHGSPVRSVLEVGAGTGRVMLPIAAAHPDVRFLGVDVDENELVVLVRSAQVQQLRNVEVGMGDMLNLGRYAEFDVVTAPFRVLQHCLSLHELALALTSMAHTLVPGGLLAFDLFNPSIPWLARLGVLTDETLADGETTVRRRVEVNQRDYFAQTQYVQESYLVEHPGRAPEHYTWNYRTRYTFWGELRPLLRDAGLALEFVHGDFNGATFGVAPYPGDIVVVARKLTA